MNKLNVIFVIDKEELILFMDLIVLVDFEMNILDVNGCPELFYFFLALINIE
jgi:hypothetical protein